jgi:3-hydroxyisobutyrate dehydrogenase-like beta-hydroxyacid dehydrogenase
MGAAVAGQLRRAEIDVLWCPTDRSDATVKRADAAGLRPIDALGDLLDRANVVLSVCPPATAEDVARSVAAHRYSGVYVDANAISPARMGRVHQALHDAGAQVVDGAIIGPPPGDGASARLYLAGPERAVTDIATLFTGTAVEAVPLGTTIGTASGLKMAYASYQKASRTLAGVAHALAADLDVTEHLLDEARRNAGSPLADLEYLPSVAARAWRWAPEMLEVAETLRAAGLPPEQAEAAAATLGRWTSGKDHQQSMEKTLSDLHGPSAGQGSTAPPRPTRGSGNDLLLP